MCNWIKILTILISGSWAVGNFQAIVTHFTMKLVKTSHVVVVGCHSGALQSLAHQLMAWQHFVRLIDIRCNFTLNDALSHRNRAHTAVVVDCVCTQSVQVLQEASEGNYLNKSYQWLLWDDRNVIVNQLSEGALPNLGPNAQVTLVNRSKSDDIAYTLWDVHTKGRHLHAPLEWTAIAVYNTNHTMVVFEDIFVVQGFSCRDRFDNVSLRGATVIDQDHISTNAQIESILARPSKDTGVAAFTKYHYELLLLLRYRLNFTVNFRNARGWAGRLGNTSFRLGYLGIMQRNEADVGASAAFNRINRFAEYDIIDQSWKFETAFLYRFSPELDAGTKSGNFLAPFDNIVWLLFAVTILTLSLIWCLVERIGNHLHCKLQHQLDTNNQDSTIPALLLKVFGAVCQQGMDPIPSGLSARAVVLTTFLFTLIMYNYYTSVVVGGLLSNNAEGPSTVNELVSSPLALSFEDIGYYKVLFRESQRPVVRRLLSRKVEPARGPSDLPVFSHLNEAIPYIKSGRLAFHCEVVDAYPEIAKLFNANEICELRKVTGLLETEILNWVVPKNSQYSEVFRVVMQRIREVGLIEQLLRRRQLKKPQCQALYTVYPVSLSEILSSLLILSGGFFLGIVLLLLEISKKRNQISKGE